VDTLTCFSRTTTRLATANRSRVSIRSRRVRVFLVTRVEGRVLGQSRHCFGTNASRGLSATAEFLIFFVILVVLLYFYISILCFKFIFLIN